MHLTPYLPRPIIRSHAETRVELWNSVRSFLVHGMHPIHWQARRATRKAKASIIELADVKAKIAALLSI